MWASVLFMQIAWQGGFEIFCGNPLAPTIAHVVRDPQLGLSALTGLGSSISSYSGLYHWGYTVGLRSSEDLMI